MKRLAMAVVLTCALSTSIFAGDMPTTGATAPTAAANNVEHIKHVTD